MSCTKMWLSTFIPTTLYPLHYIELLQIIKKSTTGRTGGQQELAIHKIRKKVTRLFHSQLGI